MVCSGIYTLNAPITFQPFTVQLQQIREKCIRITHPHDIWKLLQMHQSECNGTANRITHSHKHKTGLVCHYLSFLSSFFSMHFDAKQHFYKHKFHARFICMALISLRQCISNECHFCYTRFDRRSESYGKQQQQRKKRAH